MNNPRHDRYKQARRITLIGSLVDVLLGVSKVFVGFLVHSQALIADGIHSFSDLFTDFLVLFVAKYSHAEPDEEHPYGHERFETFGTVLLGSFLIAIAGVIIYDAIGRLIHQESTFMGSWAAIVVTVASIISKEIIFQYSRRIGEKIKSDLLIANAWHSRSDSLSSIVVLIGILGAMYGYLWLDGVAAILVAIMIGYVGWKFAYKSARELVDTGVSKETLRQIQHSIFSVEGVRSVHDLRSRRMGSNILIDVHIEVDHYISASEGHHIGVWVEQKLLTEFSGINDVVFHIDSAGQNIPDADAILLPLRAEIFDALKHAWRDIKFADQVMDVGLFYLEKSVLVEVVMPTTVLKQANFQSQQFEQDLLNSVKQLTWLESIAICYKDSLINTRSTYKKNNTQVRKL